MSQPRPRHRLVGLTVGYEPEIAQLISVIAGVNKVTQAEVIRDAVDALITHAGNERRAANIASIVSAQSGVYQQRRAGGIRGPQARFTERINTYLDGELHDQLVEYCRQEQLSKSRALRLAVDRYLFEQIRAVGLGDRDFSSQDVDDDATPPLSTLR